MDKSSEIIRKILDEKNQDVLEILGTDGNVIRFEQVALLHLEEDYVILHPLEKDVMADEVIVFHIVYSENEVELIEEENEDVIQECFEAYYQLFQKRKTKPKK